MNDPLLIEARRLVDSGSFDFRVEPIEALAQAGDAEAQYVVGRVRQLQWDEPLRGVAWMERAARSGHVEAAARLCELYAPWASCDPRDVAREASRVLRDAVESWSGAAASTAAASKAPVFQTIAARLKTLALAGDAVAAHWLGTMLWRLEDKAAEGWLLRAAHAGEPGAMLQAARWYWQHYDDEHHGQRRSRKPVSDDAPSEPIGAGPGATNPKWSRHQTLLRMRALHWYEAAATAANADAAYELAEILVASQPPRARDAAHWYEVAANAGDPTAPQRLASLLRHGHGDLQPDPERAEFWYRHCAARYEAALGGADDYAPWAMLGLAEQLLQGLGVERDVSRAVSLLEQAQAAGLEYATTALARHLMRNDAPADEIARGVAVLAAAAERGVREALSQLVHWYGPYGQGVDPDAEFHWLQRLAAAGDHSARSRLDDIEAARQRRAQQATAIATLEAALAAGQPGVRRQLAAALTHVGDHARAIALAEEAHRAGEDWAWFNLVMRYQLGTGVPVDPQRAREWKRAGARAGDPGAMLQLAADLFEAGEDPVTCAAWIRIAESPRHGRAYDLPNDETRELHSTFTASFDAARHAQVEALAEKHEDSAGTWWPGDD